MPNLSRLTQSFAATGLCCGYTHLNAAAMPGQKVPDDVQDTRSTTTRSTSSEAFQAAEDAIETHSRDLVRSSEQNTPAPSQFRVNVIGCRCRCCWNNLDPSHVDRHASPCWPRCLPDTPTTSTLATRVTELLLRCFIAAPSSLRSAEWLLTLTTC